MGLVGRNSGYAFQRNVLEKEAAQAHALAPNGHFMRQTHSIITIQHHFIDFSSHEAL